MSDRERLSLHALSRLRKKMLPTPCVVTRKSFLGLKPPQRLG
jgi:hypothetical protein